MFKDKNKYYFILMFSKILFFICMPIMTNAFKLCVVGSTSGLGRELVYQGAHDKNMSVLALSGSNNVQTIPCRVNSFRDIRNQPPFFNPNVERGNYWQDSSRYDYETLVFTTGAAPFKSDYSHTLMAKFMPILPKSCNHVILISAYGLDKDISYYEHNNEIVNSWYLRNVYEVKQVQEALLELNIFKKKYPNLKTSIYRPRALTYGPTTGSAISRQDLAKQILDAI